MQTEKKRIKLKLHVYLFYLFIVTLAFMGVTFSRYIQSTNFGDDARVASFGDLTLVEEKQPDAYIITPGVAIAKNPEVSFGLREASEMDVYVFVSVEASDWENDGASYTLTRKMENEADKEVLLSWSVDKEWIPLVLADSSLQVFYKTVLTGESLKNSPVIQDAFVYVSPELLSSELEHLEDKLAITFQAYAVQSSGFDNPLAAWYSISGREEGTP